MDMGRTCGNLIGNCLATIVVARGKANSMTKSTRVWHAGRNRTGSSARRYCLCGCSRSFLQSRIDRVLDRGGDFEWLKGHFAKSLLARIVLALLICITILEGAAGALSAVGCLLIIVSKDSTIAFYNSFRSSHHGAVFGQRVAKDYAGAALLLPYFLLTLLAIHLLTQG